jgi:hypothetical protein
MRNVGRLVEETREQALQMPYGDPIRNLLETLADKLEEQHDEIHQLWGVPRRRRDVQVD